MTEAPIGKTGTRLDDLAIDEVSGVDRPAHAQDGWMVLKSKAAQLELSPEDLAEIIQGALEIANEEGYEFSTEDSHHDTDDTDDSEGEDKQESKHDVTTEVKDEVKAPAIEPPADAIFPATDETEVLKNLDPQVRSLVLKAQADAEQATAIAKAATTELQKARDAHADREAVLKAREDWAYIPGLDPLDFGPMIRKARDSDPVFADAVAQLLTAASAALSESSLFTAAGTVGTSSGLSELDQAVLKAKESHPDYTKAQLITEAVLADPALYDSYRASQNGG